MRATNHVLELLYQPQKIPSNEEILFNNQMVTGTCLRECHTADSVHQIVDLLVYDLVPLSRETIIRRHLECRKDCSPHILDDPNF